MAKCIGCSPDHPEVPDNSVYYTGLPYPNLGIYTGMPYSKLVPILLQIMPSPGADLSQISASDVAVDKPPDFLITEYSRCWDKVGDQKGWYTLSEASGLRVFSYDFTEAITSLGHNIEVRKIEVNLYVTENGIKKSLVVSPKTSHAVQLEASKFPISFNVLITLSSSDCGNFYMYYNLSLGNIPFPDKRHFLLATRGVDSNVNSRYSLKDVIAMSNAKLAQITNFVDTIKAGDYLAQINLLQIQNTALVAKLAEEKRFEIGTGLSKVSLTEKEFMAYVLNQMKSMNEQLAKLKT